MSGAMLRYFGKSIGRFGRSTDTQRDCIAIGRGRKRDVEVRKRRALQIINTHAGNLSPNLDIENPNDPTSLRDDYLSEIGSGANRLSYHLDVPLSFHQFYLSQKSSPVPAFLALDQPSQVYFPKHLVSREVEDDPKVRDEDVDAARKAFDVTGSIV